MLLPRKLLSSRITSTSRHYSQAAAAATIRAESYTAPTQRVQSSPPQSSKCIREKLRELFRETAQPVAVVTSFMPHSSPKATTQSDTNALHHGATLSSFTSIAMDPYPLVTFALRIPSRMATTLNTTFSTPLSSPKHETPSHMVINLLSSTQAKHAVAFSRPDLYPTPFADPEIPYTLSQDGLPILDGCLGAISCRLVGPGLPLYDLGFFTNNENTVLDRADDDTANSQWQINGNSVAGSVGEQKNVPKLGKGATASELFIAQTQIHDLFVVITRRTIMKFALPVQDIDPSAALGPCFNDVRAIIQYLILDELLPQMQVVDNKSSRRSSFTHIFSPTRHHESTLRKRAQSLNAQSTRRNSILINNDSHPHSQGTLDRKSVIKLSISAPLSSSHHIRSYYTSDTDATSVPTSRTSFIDTRQCEDPPNSSERKVQFVELSLDRSRSSLRDTTRTHNVTTQKRTVARVSISSGRIYYIEEAIPEFRFPSTRFSPPPPTTPRSHSYPLFHSRSLSALSIRRRPLSNTLRDSSINRYTHHFTNDRQPDNCDHAEDIGEGFQSGVGDSSSNSFSSPQAPLYISTSEKLHAQWGMFTLNMRFSMFRAQDRMRNGVAWMGSVVKKFKPRRQI